MYPPKVLQYYQAKNQGQIAPDYMAAVNFVKDTMNMKQIWEELTWDSLDFIREVCCLVSFHFKCHLCLHTVHYVLTSSNMTTVFSS